MQDTTMQVTTNQVECTRTMITTTGQWSLTDLFGFHYYIIMNSLNNIHLGNTLS